MALHVATAARSLYRQLAIDCDATKIETQILSDITRTIATIKPLISWLNRAPFHGQQQFTEICSNMLRRGLEMATIAQRDRFAEKPVEQIRDAALRLENLANYIIQDITDPMLLQPASLNLVTLKKRESELGFSIEPNYHGIHRVTDIKYNSPAHNSGKIEDGDEIVQINYQTVVGWQYKTVLLQLRESLPDVLLTLKKRPKHTKIYGQIYMQPYRLPSKKRNIASRWGANLPSPRAGFLTVPEQATGFNLPLSLKPEESAGAANCSQSDSDSSSDSDILTPTDNKSVEKEIRLYYPKPRAMLQRRNTICGDEYLNRKCGGSGIFPQWRERKGPGGIGGDHPASPSLRDKSASFGFGLDATSPRPTTCIGLAATSTTKLATGLFRENVASTATTKKSNGGVSGESSTLSPVPEEHYKLGVSKVVRFDANMTIENYKVDEKYTCNVENTILETFEPIPFADEDDDDDNDDEEEGESESNINKSTNSLASDNDNARIQAAANLASGNEQLIDAVNLPLAARRGRLDKSHSTPAYDNSGEEHSDTPPPPAIEPRNATLLQMPPVPPPRPRKQKEMSPGSVPPPPPKPMSLKPQPQPRTVPVALPANIIPLTVLDVYCKDANINLQAQVPQHLLDLPLPVAEVNELHTPTKSRTLTLKKKHNLIAKRRNVNLKLLGTGEIQGHLYRRTKDRRGVTFWARVYFVMLDTILYGFRTKEATKASCVIFLPGFTVSLAKEVHSKPYAFKVYHAAKTFYFAAESEDALNQWVEFIRQATLQPTVKLSDINVRDLFSETESSGEENEMVILKNLSTPSPQANKELLNMQQTVVNVVNNLTGNTTKNTNNNNNNTPVSSNKHDRRYLGSLRKLTKNTLHFKSSSSSSSSSNEKKLSSDIPVPTEQYRSYRKVPGGSFGLQIGTNTPGSYHHEAALQQAILPITVTATSIAPLATTTAAAAATYSNTIDNNIAPALPRKLSLSASNKSIISTNYESSLSSSSTTTTTTATTSATNSIITNSLISSSAAATTIMPIMPANLESNLNNISFSANNQNNNNTNNGNHNKQTATMTIISTTAITSPTSTQSNSSHFSSSPNDSPNLRSIKKIPYNFIHASNPNLVEFDFQTSKTLDYSLPKINSGNTWDAHQTSIQGFVTLKDLMLQKQEEEAQEMYNNRVLLGVEKKGDEKKRHMTKRLEETVENLKLQQQQQQQLEGVYKSKTQNRSLPKTPDYEISFKPDDEDIKRTRTKEGLKLRDFGYELISGDEPISGSGSGVGGNGGGGGHSRQNSNISNYNYNNNEQYQQQHQQQQQQQQYMTKTARQFLKTQQFLLSAHRNKKHSTASISSTTSSITSGSSEFSEKRGDSFKKRGKLEAFKNSSERLFQFSKNHHQQQQQHHQQHNIGSGNTQSMTMTLPLNKKSNQISYDEHNTKGGSVGNSMRKSHTYNHDLKEKAASGANDKYDAQQRKNSAPIFSKLNFSHASSTSSCNSSGNILSSSYGNKEPKKEKKLLGSPLLHRTIFGHSQRAVVAAHKTSFGGRDYDGEIFSQVILPKVPNHLHNNDSNVANGAGNMKYRHISTTSSIISAPDVVAPPPPIVTAGKTIAVAAAAAASSSTTTTTTTAKNVSSNIATPEYPNMECPPVFEPEIYCLSDSNASLSLLMHRNNSTEDANEKDANNQRIIEE